MGRFALAIILSLLPCTAAIAQSVISTLASDELIGLSDVDYSDGTVTGVATNRTDDTLRDVRLRILCSWRWTNEKRPGTDDPSWGARHEIAEIPPGGKIAFRHAGPPPPARTDGRFHVEVTVAGLRIVKRAAAP